MRNPKFYVCDDCYNGHAYKNGSVLALHITRKCNLCKLVRTGVYVMDKMPKHVNPHEEEFYSIKPFRVLLNRSERRGMNQALKTFVDDDPVFVNKGLRSTVDWRNI